MFSWADFFTSDPQEDSLKRCFALRNHTFRDPKGSNFRLRRSYPKFPDPIGATPEVEGGYVFMGGVCFHGTILMVWPRSDLSDPEI